MKMISFYGQDCDAGYLLACNNLGILYGEVVEKDYAQAAIYFEKACQLKEQTSCKKNRRHSIYKRDLTADINTTLSKFFDTYKVYE